MRLRFSVLSWVSNLRPLAAQENCRLARTRITVLRVCRRRVPRKGDTLYEQREHFIHMSEQKRESYGFISGTGFPVVDKRIRNISGK
jgi:hypothetical protein